MESLGREDFANGSKLRSAGRYAFVLPRYGAGIAGGAETLAGSLAAQLAARGDEVAIYTTCAKDNRTWANEFPRGEELIGGVQVKRFPVDERDLSLWIPHQIKLSQGGRLSVDEQLDWMAQSVNSQELYAELLQEMDNFDAFFLAPYLFGTTFWGGMLLGKKAILIPCLHDESYAYTDVIRALFRTVRGALFNSIPEQELARQLFGGVTGGEVGMGFTACEYKRENLSPYFSEKFPYLLYIGRKETGKNVQLLIDNFLALKESSRTARDLRLVIAGGGSFADVERPHAVQRRDIVDVEHVSEEDKRRLIANALYLCQPSLNESFSIVIMEAWLLGVPVVVHARCSVTRRHVLNAGGGLYFASAQEFSQVTNELLSNAALRKELALSGRRYVEEYYNWDAVLSRFDCVMTALHE